MTDTDIKALVARLRKDFGWQSTYEDRRMCYEAADALEALLAGADTWLLEAITIWKHRAEAAEAGWKACAEGVDGARSATLEAAARVADAHGQSDEYDWPTAGRIADGIRALSRRHSK